MRWTFGRVDALDVRPGGSAFDQAAYLARFARKYLCSARAIPRMPTAVADGTISRCRGEASGEADDRVAAFFVGWGDARTTGNIGGK